MHTITLSNVERGYLARLLYETSAFIEKDANTGTVESSCKVRMLKDADRMRALAKKFTPQKTLKLKGR